MLFLCMSLRLWQLSAPVEEAMDDLLERGDVGPRSAHVEYIGATVPPQA